MPKTLAQSLMANFLGPAARWYKLTILFFLAINPIVLHLLGPFVAGWVLVGEFIFCLAMALKCYPLQPGGLLALEAIVIGMTSPETVFHEAENNFEVILLLIFMVAGIFFLKDMLLFIFTKLLIRIRPATDHGQVHCLHGIDEFLVVVLIWHWRDVRHNQASQRNTIQ